MSTEAGQLQAAGAGGVCRVKPLPCAQAAFAKVSEAQAQIAQAGAQAEANQQKQLGYKQCPTCAPIDALHALPQGITVYAPGASSSIALPTGK